MHTHELMPEAIVSYNEKCSFGHITFDTSCDDPKITFKIINIDNEVIDSIDVHLKDISN